MLFQGRLYYFLIVLARIANLYGFNRIKSSIMASQNTQKFFDELDKRCQLVRDYILDQRFIDRLSPQDIQWAATAYVRYGGKRLRPAILLFSCGAVGGDEGSALPAAAAVELFHTWTLVHDDIIDRDATRRGSSTVHQHYIEKAESHDDGFGLTKEEAKHYGISIAILTGDIQHGWGISMMTELTSRFNIDPIVTLSLINELDTNVLNTLVEGEVLDIQFSHMDIESLTPESIEQMLWKKTGALYEFCGKAGAMIGAGDSDHPLVQAVSRFSSLCGTAFQLQDDILGIIGKEESLGKPVGSDLKEGKRTLVVYYTYQNASRSEKQLLKNVLGNQDAGQGEILRCIELMRNLGGIENVAARANELIVQALTHLDELPDTPYRELLHQWAQFMIDREF